MDEPMLVRCERCSALVAAQDASRCKIHDTPPLCTFCWKDHWMRHAGDDVHPWEACWSEVGILSWR